MTAITSDAKRKRAIDYDALPKLPYLLTAHVCKLAGDADPSTVRRSGMTPVGKRGRSLVWATADVMRWLAGERIEAPRPKTPAHEQRRSHAPSTDALERLRRIRGGGAS